MINLKESSISELYAYEIALLSVIVKLQKQVDEIKYKRKELEKKERGDN